MTKTSEFTMIQQFSSLLAQHCQSFTGLAMLIIALQSLSLSANEILMPPAPTLTASSYILQDFDSGQILAEKNADVRLAAASLSKIMTVYAVFHELQKGHLTLDESTIISEKAWRTPGSRMFIEVNNSVTIRDLLKGIIIQSGNDASVALAEHITGDESTFAVLMNQHAARLGMVNSHFSDSNGLPAPKNFSTARDLAMLTKALITEFGEYYAWFSEKEFTYNEITQVNRNKLLWRDDSIDGVKTGYTEDAGYCLIASAKRNKMRLISVVMDTKSVKVRTRESQNLLNFGFRFFVTHHLYSVNQPLTQTKVWKGTEEKLNLGITDDLYVTLPHRNYKDLKAMMSVDNSIIAPVAKGQEFGTVTVSLGNQALVSKPLVALNKVDEADTFQKLLDDLLMSLQ